MEVVLIGLQFAGKSAVLDLLAAVEGPSPAQRGSQRRLSLRLPDPRLDSLAELLKPKKKTPVALSIVDPPPSGSDERSGRGGKGDPFAYARTADGLILVIGAFESPKAPHPTGSVNPVRDMKTVLSDMILADLVVLESRLERIGSMLKVGKKPESPLEVPLLERCKETLEAESPLSDIEFNQDELKLLSGFSLMTVKPILAVINVGERTPGERGPCHDREALITELLDEFPNTKAVAVCAPLELELAGMDPKDAGEFMEAEGIRRLGGEKILEALLGTCGRITFYTVIRDEARAWAVPRGSSAVDAAAAVHTDMGRGFIKAEVLSWRDLLDCGSLGSAREKGLLRLEGRDYEVQDGDVITIKFST